MTPSFFDTPERLSALRAAVARIEGTPFFANSEAPGRDGGVDCVHALNFIYRECGVIGPLEIPRQTTDHGQHADHSLLIEAFDTWPTLAGAFVCVHARASAESPDIDTAKLLPGDALCFRSGRVPHHGAVMLEGCDMLHVLRGPGAHRAQLSATILHRRILGYLAAVYRPLPRTS